MSNNHNLLRLARRLRQAEQGGDKPEKFKALKAASALDKVDYIRLDNPRCPHCGESVPIDKHEKWHLYEEGTQETTCPHPMCGLDFTVQTHVSYSFSTDEQEEMDDEEDES